MHTRSCVRLPGGKHASAAQLCLCTLHSASEKFLDIFSVIMLEKKITDRPLERIFFLSVTVVTKDGREEMKRSRQPAHESRDILSEVQENYLFVKSY